MYIMYIYYTYMYGFWRNPKIFVMVPLMLMVAGVSRNNICKSYIKVITII